MARPKNTVVNFVLDETGSMQSVKEETISGFNAYIAKLVEEAKAKVWLTLTQFNSQKIEVVHNMVNIVDVHDLNAETYVPANYTPLYDAIGQTIRTTEEALKLKRGKPEVLCVIMTDGEENASKEWTKDRIFDLIKEKIEAGWTFAFLGADQDAYAVGAGMGIPKGSSVNYAGTREGTEKAMTTAAIATSNYLDSGSEQTSDFFENADDDPNDS